MSKGARVIYPQAAPVSALRYRDFNLLAGGRFCGTTGSQMLAVGVGWQVYDLTHDPFALGMVGLCQFLPGLLLVLPVGHLADRLDRSRLGALSFLLAALSGAGLLALTLQGNQAVWPIYAIGVLLGVARVCGATASKALLPNLIPAVAYGSAVALSTMAFQIAVIGGPAVGGLLYFHGAAAVYGGAALALLTAAVLLSRIRARPVSGAPPLDWDQLLAGIRFIWARPVLLGALTLDLFAVLFGGVIALLPVYARDILRVGPGGLGLLRGAPAVGAALMALWLARHPIRRRAGRHLLLCVGLFGGATIAFGFSRDFPLSLLLLGVLGAADMVSIYIRTHLTQLHTPDHLRGRVEAVNLIFITGSNELGEFESGVTASWFGTVPATMLGGVLTLAVVAVCAWRIPTLRRLDRLETME